MQQQGELEKVLDRVEGLLSNVREAFLKEREMLEQCDIAKAADELARGVPLFEDAAYILAETLATVKRSEMDDGMKKRLEELRSTILELGQLRMENHRAGATLMGMFHQPKQTH